MRLKSATLAVVTLAISGCATYQPSTSPLDRPIKVPEFQEEILSECEHNCSNLNSASIGDDLFWVRRYLKGQFEIVQLSPIKGHSYPPAQQWKGTHTYSDNGTPRVVYTAYGYMNGQVGVILDKDFNLVTTHPLVQVTGAKSGRRWVAYSYRPFFERKTTLMESWGLRYAGKESGSYVFEVTDKRDPRKIEIVQEIKISKKEFLTGFVVKGMLIKGVEETELGIITFRAKDMTAD